MWRARRGTDGHIDTPRRPWPIYISPRLRLTRNVTSFCCCRVSAAYITSPLKSRHGNRGLREKRATMRTVWWLIRARRRTTSVRYFTVWAYELSYDYDIRLMYHVAVTCATQLRFIGAPCLRLRLRTDSAQACWTMCSVGSRSLVMLVLDSMFVYVLTPLATEVGGLSIGYNMVYSW